MWDVLYFFHTFSLTTMKSFYFSFFSLRKYLLHSFFPCNHLDWHALVGPSSLFTTFMCYSLSSPLFLEFFHYFCLILACLFMHEMNLLVTKLESWVCSIFIHYKALDLWQIIINLKMMMDLDHQSIIVLLCNAFSITNWHNLQLVVSIYGYDPRQNHYV